MENENKDKESIGEYLKKRRETIGWSKEEAARRLNLKLEIINDLEEKDPHKIKKNNSTAFVRGYLRSYAKLLGISESKLTELSSINTLDILDAKLQSFSKRTMREAADNKIMMVTYSIIFIVTVLITIRWWQGKNTQSQEYDYIENVVQEQSNNNIEDTSLEDYEVTSVDESANLVLVEENLELKVNEEEIALNSQKTTEQKESGSTNLSSTITKTLQTSDQKIAITNREVENLDNSNQLESYNKKKPIDNTLEIVQTKPASNPKEINESPQPKIFENKTAKTTQTAENNSLKKDLLEKPISKETISPKINKENKEKVTKETQDQSKVEYKTASLTFIVKDTSWIRVKDANKKYLIVGTKKAGDEIKIKGQEPFEIIITNPSVIDIIYNTATLDIPELEATSTVQFKLPMQN